MVETHLFGDFVPPNSRHLILGSFTGKQAVPGTNNHDSGYDWFYGTQRNQLWKILTAVYQRELPDKFSRQKLLTELEIAMADIIYQCERTQGSNLDTNLTNIVYNTERVAKILAENQIRTIFFTSRFVEKKYVQVFRTLTKKYPAVKLVTLPSPSPRYARMTLTEKVRRYSELLPSVEPAVL